MRSAVQKKLHRTTLTFLATTATPSSARGPSSISSRRARPQADSPTHSHSTDYDAWRVGEAPVTVEEVMKTLTTNAALSKHITASILGAVHEAVSAKTFTNAEGSMQYSLMTNHSHVSPSELYKLRYILPAYFPYEAPKWKGLVNTEDHDDSAPES